MGSSSEAIPESVMAVVAYGKGDLRVESRPFPVALPHQAIVDVAYGGICGSDLHYWRDGAAGESILRSPLVLGHEVAGRVRIEAADGSGPAMGTAVTVHPATEHPGDGSPYPADRPNLAPGSTYLGSAAHWPHTDGAFATSVALDSRMLRPLPAGLDLRTAALAEPAAVALHGLRRAGDVAGRSVLVVGCGPIGALAIALARRAGAAEIVAVDVFDAPLARALTLGAHRTLLADDAEGISSVHADVVVESSGTTPGLRSAVRGARRGGTVVMLGLQATGDQPALLSLAISRELALVGSFRFTDEIDEIVTALGDGTLAVEGVVTHEFALVDTLEAFETAANAAGSGKVLLAFG